MGDLWNRIPPAAAALLRTVLIAVVGAVLTALSALFADYQAPADAGPAFAVFVLLARFVVEGALDWYRLHSGNSPPAGAGL